MVLIRNSHFFIHLIWSFLQLLTFELFSQWLLLQNQLLSSSGFHISNANFKENPALPKYYRTMHINEIYQDTEKMWHQSFLTNVFFLFHWLMLWSSHSKKTIIYNLRQIPANLYHYCLVLYQSFAIVKWLGLSLSYTSRMTVFVIFQCLYNIFIMNKTERDRLLKAFPEGCLAKL